MGPASYEVTQQESHHIEEDQRFNSLAQEEGEGRDEWNGNRSEGYKNKNKKAFPPKKF